MFTRINLLPSPLPSPPNLSLNPKLEPLRRRLPRRSPRLRALPNLRLQRRLPPNLRLLLPRKFLQVRPSLHLQRRRLSQANELRRRRSVHFLFISRMSHAHLSMYLFWQTVTGTTAASKAKAAGKKATAKKTTKKAVAKKTSAKAAPPKPAAKVPRKSVQCFIFIGQLRCLCRCFVAHQAILKCSNSPDLYIDL